MNLFNIWHFLCIFRIMYILKKLIIQSRKINCGLTNVVYIILYLTRERRDISVIQEDLYM